MNLQIVPYLYYSIKPSHILPRHYIIIKNTNFNYIEISNEQELYNSIIKSLLL